MTLSSWNGSSRFTPAKIVSPRDPDELKAVVLDTVIYASPLRALGELHSLNDAARVVAATGWTRTI